MRLEICLDLLYREHRDQRTAADAVKDGREVREGRHSDIKDEREERREQHKDSRLEASVSQKSSFLHENCFIRYNRI